MLKVYCDRCKKLMSKDIVRDMPFDMCARVPEGTYLHTIHIAHPNGDESYSDRVDLCPSCYGELSEKIKEFMKEKCRRKK